MTGTPRFKPGELVRHVHYGELGEVVLDPYADGDSSVAVIWADGQGAQYSPGFELEKVGQSGDSQERCP